MSRATPQRWLSISDTCDRISKSRWTVTRLIKAGDLVAKKRGSARNAEVLIDEDSVTAWLRGHPVEAAETAGSNAR